MPSPLPVNSHYLPHLAPEGANNASSREDRWIPAAPASQHGVPNATTLAGWQRRLMFGHHARIIYCCAFSVPPFSVAATGAHIPRKCPCPYKLPFDPWTCPRIGAESAVGMTCLGVFWQNPGTSRDIPNNTFRKACPLMVCGQEPARRTGDTSDSAGVAA